MAAEITRAEMLGGELWTDACRDQDCIGCRAVDGIID